MKKKTLHSGTHLLILVFVLTGFTFKGKSFEKTDTGAKTVVDEITVEILFYSPSIVRILISHF